MSKKFRYYKFIKNSGRRLWFGNSAKGQYYNDRGFFHPEELSPVCCFCNFWACNSNYVEKEISYQEAVELIPFGDRAKFLKIVGLNRSNSKPIKITKADISNILTLLEKNRAFDGDRAFLIEGEKNINICYSMVHKGILLESPLENGMYFLKTNYKEHLK